MLPGTMFRVELSNKHLVPCHHLRQDAQTLGPPHRRRRGEDGNVPYGLNKARIVWRLR